MLHQIPHHAIAGAAQNVRTVKPKRVEDAALISNIRECGRVLQNIVVAPIEGATGTYNVIAGGRRWSAVCHLIAKQAPGFDASYQWDVLVVSDPSEIAAISLSENVARSPLNPVDEFRAYQDMADQGMPLERVADWFGVPVRTVQGRMRLATIAPKILNRYTQDLTLEDPDERLLLLEDLEAFTTTDNKAHQLRVFEWFENDAKPWERAPRHIREQLRDNRPTVKAPLVQFVSLAAYLGAGGDVHRDLFSAESDSSDDYLTDPDLLVKLALDKMAKAEEKLQKEGWANVEISLDNRSPWYNRNLVQANKRLGKYSKRVMAEGICFLTLDHKGKLERHLGYMEPSKPKAKAKPAREQIATGSADMPLYGQALLSDIGGARCLIMQNHLATEPGLAYDALVYELARNHFDKNYWGGSGVSISANTPAVAHELHKEGNGLELKQSDLNLDWMLQDMPEDFVAFRKLEPHEKSLILAHVVAVNFQIYAFNPREGIADTRDVIAQQLQVEFPVHWRPRAEFWRRLKIPQILGIAKGMPTLGEAWVNERLNVKKSDLVEELDSYFDPDSMGYVAELETWLPQGFIHQEENGHG